MYQHGMGPGGGLRACRAIKFEPGTKSKRERKKWEEKCEKCPSPIRQNMLIVGL